MYKIRYYVNHSILKNLLQLILTCCMLFKFGDQLLQDTQKIIILQKKVVRLIAFQDKPPGYNGPLASTDPLFKDLNILKIEDIYKLRTLQFIYDCLNGISPKQFKSWFKLIKDVHKYRIRSNTVTSGINCVFNNSILGISRDLIETNDIFIPQANTTYYGLNSIKIAGSKLWNKTPFDIRKIKSRTVFVKTLKNLLLT